MTLTFTFNVNWSGDGHTWVDESANVLHCHIQIGMRDRVESQEAAAEQVSAAVTIAPKGGMGFGAMLGSIADPVPSLPVNPLPGGSPTLTAFAARGSHSVRHGGGHHGGGHHASSKGHVPKKPPKPKHYPHQIGHPPHPSHHKKHIPPDRGPIESVAEVGTCAITLDNTSQRYSPDNVSGALYGQLLPRRLVQVIASDSAIGFSAPVFTGYIDRIDPQGGLYGTRHVVIDCVDAMALLNFQKLALPLQQGQTADQLIQLAINGTYSPAASNLMPGAEAYDTAADQWSADRTTATDIIRECVEAEFGRFFIQRDGTPTYYNRKYLIAPVIGGGSPQRLTPAITIGANDPAVVIVGRDAEQVFNLINTVTHPRSTVSTIGVVAQAPSPLLIPPIGPAGAGVRYVTLHFHDSSGNPLGATNLQLPLTASTDYVVNEKKDNGGVYYTLPVNGVQYFTITTTAINGSQITFELLNTALGPLYATRFQVRGQLITAYDPITTTVSDSTSQTAYQKRTWTHDLPLSADSDFAWSLATYLLNRYAQPFTRIDGVTIHNEETIEGTTVLSVKLFDQIVVSEPQTGLASMTLWVTGQRIEIQPDSWAVTWITERADDSLYYVLDLSALDSGAKLAV